jgi:D-alanyl-D-alanine carboxypeptidase
MRLAACLGLVLSVLTAPAQTPDSAIPATPAGTVLSAWLNAFNSGDRARLTNYLAKYEPEHKDAADSLMNFRDQTGGFALIRIEKSEPLQLEALVKEREGDNFALLQLDVSSAESLVVKGIGLHVVPRPADQPAVPRVSFDAALKALDHKAAELTSKDKFSGGLLVARSGKIVFQKSYGLADREKHIPNKNDTRFRIGSMKKMFTATAVLQLVGEGKIDLAAPLGKYLPDYPNKTSPPKSPSANS